MEFQDVRQAYGASWAIRKFNWWFREHYPSRLRLFSESTVRVCEQTRPRWLVTVGLAPLSEAALRAIGKLGVQRMNFLTDDPWNRAHFARWFLRGLAHYDRVFSPRRANLADLVRLGCKEVSYLPFGYAPEIHFPHRANSPEEVSSPVFDVVFVGGADQDRVPYLASCIRAGLRVGLFGGYWNRYRQTRSQACGFVTPKELPGVVASARVVLGLVRRANRDGHVMRTFEVPAMGGCMLTEYTDEHRALLGDDGECVRYFNSPDEMLTRLRWLLQHDAERARLAKAAHDRIVHGRHTYRDRLMTILGIREPASPDIAAPCETNSRRAAVLAPPSPA
jgi:spore maturation protein CgeB